LAGDEAAVGDANGSVSASPSSGGDDDAPPGVTSVSESVGKGEKKSFVFDWVEPTKPLELSLSVTSGEVTVYVSTDAGNKNPSEAKHDYKIEQAAPGAGQGSNASLSASLSASPAPTPKTISTTPTISTSPSVSVSPVALPRRRLLADAADSKLSFVVRPVAGVSVIYVTVVGGAAGDDAAGNVSAFELTGKATEKGDGAAAGLYPRITATRVVLVAAVAALLSC
jgi:hypothetical protein